MTNKKNFDLDEIRNTEVFKVPDNYFDTLTERVMAKIPAEETKVISINQKKQGSSNWWKWSSVAACIALAVVGTTFLSKTYFSTPVAEYSEVASYTQEELTSQEDIIEYAMLDTDDVYCYLSGYDY